MTSERGLVFPLSRSRELIDEVVSRCEFTTPLIQRGAVVG